VTSNKRFREIANERLAHVGDDIRDIDREIAAVNDLSDLLNAKKEDAKWAGDVDQIGKIKYALNVNNHKRQALLKKKKKWEAENATA
jgi:hypothetical protein